MIEYYDHKRHRSITVYNGEMYIDCCLMTRVGESEWKYIVNEKDGLYLTYDTKSVKLYMNSKLFKDYGDDFTVIFN